MSRRAGLIGLPIAFARVLWPADAWAHLVNANVGEFYAGMLHPLTSAEHLLPILALALMARQAKSTHIRWVHLVFPLALMAAVIPGNLYPSLPFVQEINLLGLGALGVMTLFAHRLPWQAILATAALIGLVLGYRSGVDMADAGVSHRFIPGVGATGFILLVLGAAWLPRGASPPFRIAVRCMGVGFVLAGAYLLRNMLLAETAPGVRAVGLPTMEELTALVKTPELTPAILVGAFLGAAGWGGAHALTPGHGKAIVGAYLVGARSNPWQAVYLGLTVTATHTLGVFTLGLVALFASKYLAPEDLYPWLGAASGLLVLAIGASMLVKRWKDFRGVRGGHGGHDHDHGHDHGHDHVHDHDHDLDHGHEHEHDHDHGHDHDNDHVHDHGHNQGHDHVHDHGHDHHHNHHNHQHDHDHHRGHSHLPPGADGSAVTWRSLLGLGISGGLLPCPAALVLLLAAVSLHRTGLGLALVFAFSLGLAGVLTAVGLLFVKGGQLINRSPRATAMTRFLPVVSSLVIAVIGALITARSVMEIGVL